MNRRAVAFLCALTAVSSARAAAADEVCGDGYCATWAGESSESCPRDCGPPIIASPDVSTWSLRRPTWLHVGASFESAAVFAEGDDADPRFYDHFSGMAVGFSVRVEAAFTPSFSLMYQNAFLGGYARRFHVYGGFGDCNTLLLSARVWDHLELGVGGSGDVIVLSATGDSFGLEVLPGLHGRLGYRFKPRGLVLSLDAHRSFADHHENPILWIATGVGSDFF